MRTLSKLLTLAWLSMPVFCPAALAAPPTAIPAGAEEWPRWRGPRGDGVSHEALPDAWPAGGPKVVWKQPSGMGYASPIGYDGKIYVFAIDGSKEMLACHDAATGKVIWAEGYATPSIKVDYDGARATPTIDGTRIYTMGSRGTLVSRELADGKEVWRVDLLKELKEDLLGSGGTWGQAGSPLIVGDVVYVQGGKNGPIAAALDKKSGQFVWKSEAQAMAGYATPLMIEVGGKPQLIILGGETVFDIDPATGKTIWQESWKSSYDVNAATPVYSEGRLFISSSGSHGCMMLELSPTGAKKLWEKKDIQTKLQPAILDGGFLYANSDEKRGTIKCMKWPTGEIAWEAKEPKLGPGGSLVRSGNKLVAMSDTGMLSLLHATPEAAKLLGQMQLVDRPAGESRIWATPLLYRGKLYVKGETQLVCADFVAK